MTSHQRLRDTWLLRRHETGTLAAAYGLLTGTWVAVGWLLVHPLADSWLGNLDGSVARWFVDRRTADLDSLSYIGSMMSDTAVKVVITAIVAIAMLARWRRWLEPLMVVTPLVLEALSFISITIVVGRPRPAVPRLEGSPVDSSFPSGHVAAAVVYSAILVVIFWHTRNRWARGISAAVAVLLPVCVGLARMYRGMHHLTDVVMGALLGGVSVAVCAIVLRRAVARQARAARALDDVALQWKEDMPASGQRAPHGEGVAR